MLVVPSPKFQAHVVTEPVVVLVNATLKGAMPLAWSCTEANNWRGRTHANRTGCCLARRATGSGGGQGDSVGARRAVDVRRALCVAGGAVAEVPGPRGDRSGGRVGERDANGATPVAGLGLKLTTGAGALTLIAVAAVLLAVPPGPVAERTTV